MNMRGSDGIGHGETGHASSDRQYSHSIQPDKTKAYQMPTYGKSSTLNKHGQSAMQSNANLIMNQASGKQQESPYKYSGPDTGSSFQRYPNERREYRLNVDQGYNSSTSYTSDPNLHYDSGGSREGARDRTQMRMAQIREAHGRSPIQKATQKQMFANRNDPFKPYS